MIRHTLLAAAALTATLSAQTVQPPFDTGYSIIDLGNPTGVPANLGGVTFKWNDPTKLLVGGGANGGNGAIYEIGVTRDAQGHLTGFSGTATLVSTAPYIDGGLAYAPNGVLFYTGYPVNTMGQIKPGSTVPDRIDTMTTPGVGGSLGTLAFTPSSFPGAGQLKLASYSGGGFYGFSTTLTANGTYDYTLINGPAQINGGPEGILYVPPGSNLIPDYQYVLINEYGFGSVVLYQLDSNGNPVPASRTPFLTGLGGAEGACTDPITGALVFSTYGGGNRIVVVEGFGVCGSHTAYGTGITGQVGTPVLSGGGCAGRGQFTSVGTTNGRPNAAGLLAVGFGPNSVPLFNGTLLVDITTTYFHFLDASGHYTLSLYLPIDPIWNGLNIYTQSFYVDAAAAFGVSATNGLHTLVR